MKSPPVCGATKMRACSAPVGNDDGGAFEGLLVPGVDLGEPVVGREVGGAAQEGDDEERWLDWVLREIGLDPELVAGLQVGDFGDGKSGGAAGDADVDLGADEIEACAVRSVESWGERCREEEAGC